MRTGVSLFLTNSPQFAGVRAGRDAEESEKRLGAALLAGQPLVCIDNISGALSGDALCQYIERHRPQVRVLGKSELIAVETAGVTWYANGNNLIISGDLCRRVAHSDDRDHSFRRIAPTCSASHDRARVHKSCARQAAARNGKCGDSSGVGPRLRQSLGTQRSSGHPSPRHQHHRSRRD
jgi:hypothetical protein